MGSNILRPLKDKFGWPVLKTRTLLRRRMFDCLRSSQVEQAMQEGCLYSAVLPPLLKDDPIFADPTITVQGDVAPIFVNPRREFVYHLRHPVLLEPQWGYLLARPYTVIDESLPYSEFTRSQKTMGVFYGLPTLRDFQPSRHSATPIRKEEIIISMRYPWPAEVNYYHTYMDILSRLAMLEQHGIDRSIPIVVGANLAKQRFFQEIISRGGLAERRWIVQDGFYVEAQEAIFARTNEGHRDRLDFLLDLIDAPCGDRSSHRRIFLVRNAAKSRCILNMEQLTPILKAFEFEIIDPEAMSLEQQMALFSSAAVVAGVHGAGLINMMFRRNAPMKVLEIFSPTETPLHFYALANQYGFQHHYIQGHSPDAPGRAPSFLLDPHVLREKLCTMNL